MLIYILNTIFPHSPATAELCLPDVMVLSFCAHMCLFYIFAFWSCVVFCRFSRVLLSLPFFSTSLLSPPHLLCISLLSLSLLPVLFRSFPSPALVLFTWASSSPPPVSPCGYGFLLVTAFKCVFLQVSCLVFFAVLHNIFVKNFGNRGFKPIGVHYYFRGFMSDIIS